MNERTREQINNLLADPQSLIRKKPFVRGTSLPPGQDMNGALKTVDINDTVQAQLPNVKRIAISQQEFIRELDPDSHKILFDTNIPSITTKVEGGGYVAIEYKKMAVPYQQMIRDKHVLHLCGNKMQFTLMNTNPTEKQNTSFATFKQYWDLRNMDGRRTKMVYTQKSFGDAGMLFYFDYNGEIKARILSYEDGYVLCPHNDDNGDRILESVYYRTDDAEYIDSYDDRYMYRYVLSYNENGNDGEWKMLPKKLHGFEEIPLITKRGNVAWNEVQSIIEVYEIIYNIFLVIQKRHGWGILYIKGKFKEQAKKIAGSVILNDTTAGDGKGGSAEFKAPPSPQNMIDTLSLMDETIQKGAGATFILPKDVKSSGDISAQAIMLTQARDIETALQGEIEWQNVADKMCRLFKYGLSKELTRKGIMPTAITDFNDIRINAKFKMWRPHNDADYNSQIIQLKQSGCISEDTAIEKNTMSSPDEKMRRQREKEEIQREKEAEAQRRIQDSITNNQNKDKDDGADGMV